MPHLLQIHIGPVQSFIAAARRSRDLWFGSWLLSELSKAAARGIAENDPAGINALIFPAPQSMADLALGKGLDVANKIVAVINGPPKDVADKARDAVDDRLERLRDATFDATLRGQLEDWDTVKKQLADFREFYWVAVPLGEDGYADARALADMLLAARKNTRSFGPVGWGSSRPKSSLDGARESVIPKDASGDAQTMYKWYRARPGEQLSGVDLLKRLGRQGDESRFPSTSHMAALPLEAQLAEKANKEAWGAYLDKLPPAVKKDERAFPGLTLPNIDDADGSLLFGARLADYFTDKEAHKAAAKALREFYKASKNAAGEPLDEPDPYYALLAGDGDRMGEAIDRLDTPEKNRKFSRALAGFAARAREIVAEHGGATIYAGGDDVLALLPVHTAVRCAGKVAEAFREAMGEYGVGNEQPTFSAGLVIAHHLEPLEDALNLARDAEKRAKDMDSKNALAITLDKRSGAPRTIVGRWSMQPGDGGLDERLLDLAALHQAGDIPDRLAYQLRDMVLRLTEDSDETLLPEQKEELKKKISPIVIEEAKRLVGRKQAEGGKNGLPKGSKTTLDKLLSKDADVRALADELVIAAHIAKVCQMAGLTPRGEPLKKEVAAI